ncbi:AAA-ATPase At3g50940-like, partial [Vicia villosa]|uniref:AAA-ATPase At3g50940-like n=1 Tax=Vicia villosa TaxID=3911 RepID=UPI00273B20F3
TIINYNRLIELGPNSLHIPLKLRNFILSKLQEFFSGYRPSNEVSLLIDQIWDGNTNNLFYAAKEYLPTKISNTYKSLKVGKISDHDNLLLAFDGKQQVLDEFEGIKIKWMLIQKPDNDNHGFQSPNPVRKIGDLGYGYPKASRKAKESTENGFVLSFDEKHRDKIMEKYIPHVLSTYEAIKAGNRTLKIHSMQDGHWQHSDFNHPASFDSLALDPDLKKSIIDDIDRFLSRKKFYKKVGKPWKRGYLLYGPPGTGKSSLIAAIAKYLKFDVYDLDLSLVYCNSQLTTLMRGTSNRSIIVVEDIDCNKEVLNRSKAQAYEGAYPGFGQADTKTFTMSGLLNCMDGLWSSFGDERIFIFTTNHKDKVDSALLRPGRMDKHIHLSFLETKAFKILASNYLDIEEQHQSLIQQVEELLEKVDVTPAVVAEHLLRNEDAKVVLEGLFEFLHEISIEENEE